MYLRLAFAVAAHLEPEILLVDEVLAVGDAEFQKKCLGKMQNVADRGLTVLFVSHNMAAVQALCSRGICLSEGRVVNDASAADAVRSYVADFTNGAMQPLTVRTDRKGDGQLRFTACWLENNQGVRIDKAMVGRGYSFLLCLQSDKNIAECTCLFQSARAGWRRYSQLQYNRRRTRSYVGARGGSFVCEIKEVSSPSRSLCR